MLWSVVVQVSSTILELLQIGRLSDQEKDLEILVLRKQLAMMEQRLERPVRLSRAERLTLAVITAKLKAVSGRSINQLRTVMRIVQPETVLHWHRGLVRRKWVQQSQHTGGRPRTPQEIERLIVRFARENVDWGYGKIQGELLKLGHDISEETLANILERHGIPLSPKRGASPRWRNLMTHY